MSGPKAEAILSSVAPESSARKKRKKKHQDTSNSTTQTSSGLILKDEDESCWNNDVEEEENEPVVETIANFKGKSNNESKWTLIKPSEETNEERVAEDEQPQIVEEVTSGVTGGLQTADQIKAHLKSQKMKQKMKESQREEEEEVEEETVYRDSSGKKIDTKQLRAEEKRRQAKDLEKAMRKMEWGKGLVQRDDKKADADELSKIASQPFARTINDQDMNQEMKGVQRWNDPAAGFLTKPSKSTSKPTRPKYNGPPPPPNRYGIPPGYRWDGVDRSNGFEKKLFATGNDKKRIKAEAYSYSVDDM